MDEMTLDNIDGTLMVQGALNNKLECVSNPYEGHDISSKQVCSRFRRRGRHKQCLYSKDLKALNFAATINNVSKVKWLVGVCKVNPNAGDTHGRRAIHIASSLGYADVVQTLIDHNADANLEDELGNTPLHLAVYSSSIDTVSNLLKGGCRIRRTALMPHTPLELARRKYNLFKSQDSKYYAAKCQAHGILQLLKSQALLDMSSKAEMETLAAELSSLELQEKSEDIPVDAEETNVPTTSQA